MAVSKVILNGTTLMDVTGDTVAVANLLTGYTAHGADGGPVSGAYVPPTGTKNITISSAGTTTEDVTNYASAAITVAAGTAGTPSASKGAVSNHSVNVTPSVTNTTGFITGSTKTGTAVTVTASELVSGTMNITSNGTGINVANYAAVNVNVSGGGGDWEDITEDFSITNITEDFPYSVFFNRNTHEVMSSGFLVIDDPSSLVEFAYTGSDEDILESIAETLQVFFLTPYDVYGYVWFSSACEAEIDPQGDFYFGFTNVL
jgi:hypothetical protein